MATWKANVDRHIKGPLNQSRRQKPQKEIYFDFIESLFATHHGLKMVTQHSVNTW